MGTTKAAPDHAGGWGPSFPHRTPEPCLRKSTLARRLASLPFLRLPWPWSVGRFVYVGLTPLLGLLGLLRAVARQVQLDDHAVVDEPVDRRRGRHRILEDRLPARERQVARQQHAATLVTLRQQREQYLHLLSALLHIAQVVHDQGLVAEIGRASCRER